jgi:hypothetical protein
VKAFLRALLRLGRRLLGTEQILQAQRQQLEYQRRSFAELKQQLLKANSLLKYSLVDPEKVRASATYKRCAELISLLMPMDEAGGSYVRVGRPFDGGYVMLDNFSGNSGAAAYSFGISNDVSWDEAIAARAIDVFLFDHTIDALPRQHPRFHFARLGVTGYQSATNLETLAGLVTRNAHAASNNLILRSPTCGAQIFKTSLWQIRGGSRRRLTSRLLRTGPTLNWTVFQQLPALNRALCNNCLPAWLWNAAVVHQLVRNSRCAGWLYASRQKPVAHARTLQLRRASINWF